MVREVGQDKKIVNMIYHIDRKEDREIEMLSNKNLALICCHMLEWNDDCINSKVKHTNAVI